MDELVKQLPALGVGGLIAVIIFYWYRKDVERYTLQWKDRSDQQELVISKLMDIVEKNTEAQTKLGALVSSLHDHLIYQQKLTDRREDESRKS